MELTSKSDKYEPLGYFELHDPCLVNIRKYFNNLDKNTPEENIAIARENIKNRENVEYVNIEIRNKFNIPTTRHIKIYDIEKSVLSPYNFNKFNQFKSGIRSSNSIEGIKRIE
uniref:Uncharacterized protein n=1 Tax=Mimivirus LCMiAC02 TaxID=2506609 RepID=A0A481Z421_9VIRU|nr:MAG: hypothetical protein LCMiAC02_02600 [Mimivirus LCMiAC02]